jgi:hypothetical protein
MQQGSAHSPASNNSAAAAATTSFDDPRRSTSHASTANRATLRLDFGFVAGELGVEPLSVFDPGVNPKPGGGPASDPLEVEGDASIAGAEVRVSSFSCFSARRTPKPSARLERILSFEKKPLQKREREREREREKERKERECVCV